MEPTEEVSDRLIPVLTTILRQRPCDAIWVDALCTPSGPPRRECLRRLGEIYGSAHEVVAVLSDRSELALRQVRATGKMDAEGLLALEHEAWFNRVWTYQELVNNARLRFVTCVEGGAWAKTAELLEAVVIALDDFKKAQGYDGPELRARHPRLDEYENLLADWKVAGYEERSAYQVMTSMVPRTSVAPDHRIAAMIGAIGTRNVVHEELGASTLTESFLQACEAKGDFSFIYATDARADVEGARWRPGASGRLEPILPWHCWGPGQPGTRAATHLELRGMWPAPLGQTRAEVVQGIARLLPPERQTGDFAQRILGWLREFGFRGSGDAIETQEGLLFTHRPVPKSAGPLRPMVTTGLRTAFGAPGLVLAGEGPRYEWIDVGFFVGTAPKVGQTVCVG